MSGHTGPITAPWTPLVRRRSWGASCRVVTKAQLRLIQGLQEYYGNARYVLRGEVRSARALKAAGLGVLRDDGGGPGRYSNEDGERWWFTLLDDVEIVQGGS